MGEPVEVTLTREAVEVDGFQKFEEFDSVLWVLGKVFVDHLQGTLEHVLHDSRHLVLHQALRTISMLLLESPNSRL